MVNKILGFVFSGLGLASLVISGIKSVKEKVESALPESIAKIISPSWMIISLILLALGIFLIITSGKRNKQVSEEVPIYEGGGKNRKIVGYRRN